MTTCRDAPSTDGYLLKVSVSSFHLRCLPLPSMCNREVILNEPEESRAEMLGEGELFLSIMLLPPFLALSKPVAPLRGRRC